eukprot:gb/GFBE01045104.1/.p1 GENE.gb/GFBE01045104.1/~~gb/GFBE01045104.1/.p1  ORF type:complete len:757 (+),score=120.07 gb/GFBE01045104.1/:1-2271(+)
MSAMDEDVGAAALANFFLHMPHEVWAGFVWNLHVPDVGRASACCKLFAQETADAELWFHLFLRTCWPPSGALLAFAEGATNPVGIDWRARLQSRAASVPTIVVDMGRGYSKFTIVNSISGRLEDDGCAPKIVQLCSSPTHPPDCNRDEQLMHIQKLLTRELVSAAMDPSHKLHSTALASNLKPSTQRLAMLHGLSEQPELNGCIVRLVKFAEDSGLWTVYPEGRPGMPVTGPRELQFGAGNLRILQEAKHLPILVGEPFSITVMRAGGASAASFDEDIREQLGNDRPGPVHVVSQAQMALWAHGIDHGIVVNLGQAQTIALPVVNGEVAAACAASSNMGSMALTQRMVSLMGRKYRFIDSGLMTWCRDLKERYCYVSPPSPHHRGSLSTRLAAGDDFGVRSVQVELPEEYAFADQDGERIEVTLAEERVLVPEMLFESLGGPSLPMLIVGCAARALRSGQCDQEGVRTLLRQVVLVGGAADFPGLRPRVEFEMRCLLKESMFEELRQALASSEDAFVLNPPLGDAGPLVSPRFVPLFGGCVRAASSAGYGALHGDTVGALRSLPLSPEAGAGEAGGMRSWLRRRLLQLDGPAVFRTGGGGGEDDQVWRILGGDEDDEDNEDYEDDDDIGTSSSEDGGLDDGSEDASLDDMDGKSDDGEGLQDPAHDQGQGGLEHSRGAGGADGMGQASSASTAPLSGAEDQAAPRGGQGGQFARGGKGNGRSKGKGKSNGTSKGKGKGKGKGKARGVRVWRPVQRS